MNMQVCIKYKSLLCLPGTTDSLRDSVKAEIVAFF